MSIGEGLKRFRNEFSLNQRQVASAINIHWQAYQRYEYGTNIPSAAVLIKLADAYNVSLDYLVGRSDNPEMNK